MLSQIESRSYFTAVEDSHRRMLEKFAFASISHSSKVMQIDFKTVYFFITPRLYSSYVYILFDSTRMRERNFLHISLRGKSI